MEVKLKSDFVDYYDHWFDRKGEVFERYSTGGLSRKDMFAFMSSVGLTTPTHGTVLEIYNNMDDFTRAMMLHMTNVVVYTDNNAHRGEGKVKISLAEAILDYPEHFACLHIPSGPFSLGTSLRYLQIGDRPYWLEYSSSDDWRSNCGDVTIKILSVENPAHFTKIEYPLFAVDFVRADRLYAVDFNIAPGIKGTGIEHILGSSEVVESIKKAILHFGGK